MTPAEQLASDVLQWSEYHPFVPDGTSGAYCGARSPGYQAKCGRRDSEEVHHHTMTLSQMASQEAGAQAGMRMLTAPTFTFNPPTASELVDTTPSEPQRLPYELRRVMLGSSVQLSVRRVGPKPPRHTEDTRPRQYTRPCKRASSTRNACYNEIDVYRVVTGTHTVPLYPHADPDNIVHTRTVEDCVYYWADTAIVVETGTEDSRRIVQVSFCSMKCLSLWAAKIARDTES